MRLHELAATLALAAMLVTAGCAGAFGDAGPASASSAANADGTASGNENAAAATSPPATGGRTIEVAAAGQVETEPNQAVLRVAVTATGRNASIVRRRLAENASRMREALAGMGIESGRIVTADYDIDRNFRHGPRERDEPPFRGRHAFTITLTDLDRTGEVVVVAVENGATSVDDVRFTLSEAERRELRKEALADAMANAREQADVIAESAGLSVTGVGAVRTADVHFRPVRFEAAAAGGDGGTTIEGGSVTVTAQVQVTYNATAGG